MGDISTWLTTAAGNNTGSTPDYPIEGMAPSAVNDTMRENMAAIARWYADMTGRDITTAGTGAAYTLTTTNTHAALGDQPIIVFEADRASSGDDTLNVDGLGAKTIKKHHDVNLEAGDIEANQVCVVSYSSTDDTYQLLSPLSSYAAQKIDLGGDFDASQEVVCILQSNVVTITSIGTLTHSSSSQPSSLTGAIPADFRPSNTITNVYQASSVLASVFVQSNGTLGLDHRDQSGAASARSDSVGAFTISYVITGGF